MTSVNDTPDYAFGMHYPSMFDAFIGVPDDTLVLELLEFALCRLDAFLEEA